MEYGRRILRVELRADVPAFVRNLDDFHQIGGGIDAYTLHALRFVLVLILVVELIAVAVALTYCK